MYPAPRMIRLGGRVLTVEDAGPESGFPVVVHSGGGSRHLFPPAVREARRYSLRLISYDRPGYGGSTPMPGRVVADCAADVRAVLGELGITRLAVWGFSRTARRHGKSSVWKQQRCTAGCPPPKAG